MRVLGRGGFHAQVKIAHRAAQRGGDGGGECATGAGAAVAAAITVVAIAGTVTVAIAGTVAAGASQPRGPVAKRMRQVAGRLQAQVEAVQVVQFGDRAGDHAAQAELHRARLDVAQLHAAEPVRLVERRMPGERLNRRQRHAE